MKLCQHCIRDGACVIQDQILMAGINPRECREKVTRDRPKESGHCDCECAHCDRGFHCHNRHRSCFVH